MQKFSILGASLLAAAAVLAGCHRTLSETQAEQAIKDHFGKTYGVDKVTCPPSIKLEVGTEFVCQIAFTGGDTFDVTAKVDKASAEGGHFDFKIKDPIFDPQPTAKWIADELLKQSGHEAKVDCGKPRKPKSEDTCTATATDGTNVVISIEVNPDGSPKRFEVKPQ